MAFELRLEKDEVVSIHIMRKGPKERVSLSVGRRVEATV